MMRRSLTAFLLAIASVAAAQDPPGEPEVPVHETAVDQLFVRREVNLRTGPSVTSQSLGLLEPGVFAKQLETSPDGAFVKVRTEDDREGWVAKPFLTSYRAHELRRALEELPNLEVAVGAQPETFSVRATSPSCGKTFLTCPTSSCVTDSDKKQFNRDKRTFPNTTATPKRLTHDILAALETEAQHEVGVGGPPTPAERTALLAGFAVSGTTYKLGDYVEIMGYIASDRTVDCGGGESVNCGLESSAGTCNSSDIHVPLVTKKSHKQWKSVVVEPIA